MFDRSVSQMMAPSIQRLARQTRRLGLTANQLTLLGFVLGLLAAFLIAFEAYLAGAVAILASRLLDALDGAVARLTQATDAGGFLDIALDFVFYASIPLAFAVSDPARNALPAAVLLAAFIGTGSSFLAFAVMAAKRGLRNLATPNKSFYFLGGLTEASETLLCFMAMCVWPGLFIELAYGFAALCAITTATRIWWGWKTFQ
ncbi:CDP-alcohol phosphatidyltransferase family protein [Rhodoferax sp.]|jgi:phosphatidylglycerophosphate synthase|uniref:CDP-alcohol phosphatidyltransferase family protein n=1 Tax=Rhodoferax sp. TaxID=50421 RepID=UPI00272FF1FA|nr:CDP-alcohol phosphatidyltransferase family protein [Rhodoferax sp.]MDP1529919.1 CDP-alcohol phosphatidyltransferase family protein [Rhodoferax sp.]MDP1942692.1 CDP-alcohol phosphatidyltransferase family protein [Rhodoferax sp.]MDP2442571.1 CDP-alcohol phosphatidyltransferase family protein [Rhodoferax sp.]MDZ4206258.1 CDP-alcohol phosphatidyltransferase family protein [Rhodoferax sp.]